MYLNCAAFINCSNTINGTVAFVVAMSMTTVNRVGTLIASSLSSYIDSSKLPLMKLKWPNDLLIDGAKVCGTLIEMEGEFLLIGIGCNILSAPQLPPKAARAATCLAAHSSSISAVAASIESKLIDTAEVSADTAVDGNAVVDTSGYSTGRPGQCV